MSDLAYVVSREGNTGMVELLAINAWCDSHCEIGSFTRIRRMGHQYSEWTFDKEEDAIMFALCWTK